MRSRSPLRQFAFERLTIGALALGLAAMAVAPGGAGPTLVHDAPCDEAAPALSTIEGAPPSWVEDVQPRTGIDLEVRVLNLRVEFPWMRALPISPGHHIVISLLARDPDAGRP